MSFPTITSPSNDRVKRAFRLRRGTHRRDQQRTLIDGVRELAAAAAGGAVLEEIFFCPALLSAADTQWIEALRRQGTAVSAVTELVLSRLAFGQRAEGVVAVALTPRRTLDHLTLPENPLVAVLEGVQKPGNLGAIIRSADAAGVSAVIVADADTDLFNPNAIRSSLGTIFRLPVCAAGSAATLAWLRRQGLRIVAARLDGKRIPWEVELTGPTAILLGAEATGLTAIWSGDDVTSVRLPMVGNADSLNVSAAAAVLFYEALRQRQATL